jgi:sensor domain CHASE-containing protein
LAVLIDSKKTDKQVMNSKAEVRKVSLRLKLTIIFIGIAVLTVTLTALATFQKSRQALEAEAFRKLTAIREMKANQIEDFFRHIEGQIRLLSEDDSVASAILKFQKGAEDLAPGCPRARRAEISIAFYQAPQLRCPCRQHT